MIQEVYRRYGKHGAAMTANVITYRGRSAAREIGKALMSAVSYYGGMSACMFQPGIALRFRGASDSVQALVCFLCDELVFEQPGGRALSDRLMFKPSLRTASPRSLARRFPTIPHYPSFATATCRPLRYCRADGRLG